MQSEKRPLIPDINYNTSSAIAFVAGCITVVIVATTISFSWCASSYLTNKAAFENGYHQRNVPGTNQWYWEKTAERNYYHVDRIVTD